MENHSTTPARTVMLAGTASSRNFDPIVTGNEKAFRNHRVKAIPLGRCGACNSLAGVILRASSLARVITCDKALQALCTAAIGETGSKSGYPLRRAPSAPEPSR